MDHGDCGKAYIFSTYHRISQQYYDTYNIQYVCTTIKLHNITTLHIIQQIVQLTAHTTVPAAGWKKSIVSYDQSLLFCGHYTLCMYVRSE